MENWKRSILTSAAQNHLLLFPFFLLIYIAFIFFLPLSLAIADPYPPYWNGGSGPSIHFPPVSWPNEPADPKSCGNACGQWLPYTRFQSDVADPRTQDPSNGGTEPQNYVNVSSSCVDKTFPSIYYYLHQGATPDDDVIMFRWRVEQIANNYATGPSAGSFGATDPWSSALWSVLFDIDGDGFLDLAAHLDGSSGAPAKPIDRIVGIWSKLPTQSLDYVGDPTNVLLLAHNPTAFVDDITNRILNFSPILSGSHTTAPDPNWPNGSSETVWDYGTTRAKLVTNSPCNEYFVDYQIAVKMLDASGSGGPKITRSSPISMLFCTANSLNNPFQKDCVINKHWIGEAGKPAPFGDYISFNQAEPYSQPIVSSITAAAPSTCPGNYTLTAKVQDTIAIVNGIAAPTVKAVDFYYYYDANGNGLADDAGSSWTKITPSATLKPGSLNSWTVVWDATSLPRGKYIIGVQALDTEYQDVNGNGQYDAGIDVSLLDDGMTPTEAKNRTFSYLTQTEVNGLGGRPANETWYTNPDVTGMQTILIGLALNACGVAPTLAKTASSSNVTAGGTVDFTLTINNPMTSAITLTQISDILPSGFSYGSNLGGTLTPTTSPGGGATGTITWTFSPAASVAPGGSATLIFRATASTVTGTYSNTASAATSFGTLNSNPVTVAVGSPRLTLSKAASALSFNQGDPVTYTITYSNDSPVDVTHAVISDTLPAGITYVSSSSGGIYAGGTITWNLASLPSGSGPHSATFQATVNNPYGASVPLVNTASIVSDQTPSTTATASSYVNVPYPNIAIQKSANNSLVAPGSSVTFTIAYANNGTAGATGVLITDTMPSGFTYSSCAVAGSTHFAGCSNSSGTVTFHNGSGGGVSIPVGESGSLTVTMTAGNPYTASNPQTNTASVTWTGHGTPVTASGEVGVTQSGNVCNTYYFENTQQNVGTAGTQYVANSTLPSGGSVNISQCLPQNLTTEIARFYQDPVSPYYANFAAGSTMSGQIYYTKAANGSCANSTANANMTLTVKIYDYDPVGGTETLLGTSTYVDNGSPTPPVSLSSAMLSGALQKGHRLLWVVSGTMSNNKDTYLSLSVHNGQSSVQVCSPAPGNLILDKGVDKATAAPGDSLTYTLHFSNSGQAATTGSQIVDTLPAGVSFSSATLNGSSATPTGSNPYTFTVNSSGSASGTIAAGASGTLVITGTISNPLDSAIASVTNNASLISAQTAAVTDTATTAITGRGPSTGAPSLSITKGANNTLLKPGDTVTYSVTVLNSGTAAATNVTVTDTLPGSPLAYVAGSIAGGDSRSVAGSLASWTVNSLAPGNSSAFTFQMLAGTLSGVASIDNTASATATGLGTTSSNTVTVSISSNPNLSLTKSASAPSGSYFRPGDTIAYTLVVTNNGSGDASNVVVTDLLPADLSYQAIAQGAGSFDAVNNRVVFTVGTLAAGGSTTLRFTATVNTLPAGNTTISNTATVTASNASTRTAAVTATANAGPGLTLSKTSPPQTAYPAAVLSATANNTTAVFVNDATQLVIGQYVSVGGTVAEITDITGKNLTLDQPVTALSGAGVIGSITYGMTYQNTGDAAAVNATLTDTLPGGSIFVEATSGGSYGGGVVAWNLGNLVPGASGTVQVILIPGNAGTLVNNAGITCTNCSGPTNASASTSVGGLRATKSTSTPTRSAGEVADYAITVSNSLSSAVANVAVTDLLPSGFSYKNGSAQVGGSPSEPAFDPADTGMTQPIWSGLTIPAGGQLVINFQADIAASTGAATYQNGVTVTAPAGTGVIPFDPLLTTAEDVTVLAGNTGIVEGHVFIDNNDNGIFDESIDTPLPGINVHITDSSATVYIIATDEAGFFSRVIASGNATVDVQDGDIPAGLTLGSGFSDPAAVSVPDGGSVKKDTGYISLSWVADLTIMKAHTGNFTQGQTGAQYAITVSNVGPGPTSGTVTVTDTLPMGLTASTMSGAGWSCTLATLTCTRSDALAAGSSYPAITLTVDVAGNAPSSLTNTVTVSGGGELNTSNDTASDPTTVVQVADLTITKTHVGNFTQGQTGAQCTITVSNIGSGPTSGTVTVTDTLPTGLTASAISGTGWSCTLATLTCTRSDALAASGSYPAITLTVDVAGNAPSSLTNTVTVSGGGELNTSNDTASDPTTITQVADLTTTKTHVGNFTQGQTGATYTITVSNSGAGPTSGPVTVTDTLPSGLTASAISGTGWSCTLATLTCTRSDVLAAGSSYPAITLTVDVAGNASASVTNTAAVSGGGELNTANDTASDPTTVTQVADLTIAKTHTGNFTQGQTGATYTITVSNIGSGPTSGTVTVTDTLPSGLTASAISGTGWSCTLATLTCTRSDVLAAGSSYPAITLTVNAANNAPANVTNTAMVSGGGELNTANDTASDPRTVTQVADLTIAKTHTGNFTQGQTGAQYTITVSNIGSGPTSGTVTVTDTLPAGLTATAIAGTGWSCTLATLTCTRSDALALGSSYPVITLTVDVAGNASASVTNTAAVSGGGELNTANDTTTDPTTVNALADLSITKTANNMSPVPGDTVVFTLTVTNHGPSDATGVEVLDHLPLGVTYQSDNSGGSYNHSTGVWQIGNLANGASVSLTITVKVNQAGRVVNIATITGSDVSDPDLSNNSSGLILNLGGQADLAISKEVDKSNPAINDTVVFILTVTNNGPDDATGVQVSDALPAGLTYQSDPSGGAYNSGTGVWTVGNLNAGNSAEIQITALVSGAGEKVNTARITGSSLPDPDRTNNQSSVVINPDSDHPQIADLAVQKTVNQSVVSFGGNAVFTIVVRNNGPDDATNVKVEDVLPSGVSYVLYTATQGTYDSGTGIWTAGNLPAGAYALLDIVVQVNDVNPQTNTARIDSLDQFDPNSSNDSDSAVVSTTAVADLTVTKSHVGNFTQGQTGAQYTITVTNSGAGPTAGTVTVTDTLPTGLTATGISGTGWSCTLATLTCTRSDVLAASGNYPAITLTVDVAGNAASSLTNTATVSGGGEINTANDAANDPTTIVQVADLTITKTHSGNFAQGETGAQYTITVSNVGPGPTSGTVTVMDTLPTGLTATGISGTGWSCTLATLTCTRSDVLAASGSYPAITLTVDVAGNAPASVTNTATVSGGEELNTSNDTASDPTTIVQVADLTITKTHVGNFTQGQTGAQYTITVSNLGPGPTSGLVTVTDTLPTGLTAAAMSGTGWGCTLGTLTCTRSDVLVASASYPAITLTVDVAGNAPAGVTNTATVSGGGELNTSNDTATDPTTIVQVADLTITKTHVGNFTQGQTGATYTITVTNSGPGPTSGTVTVTDTLPAGLTATGISGTGWSCTLATLTCTRSDVLVASASYPAITLTVDVASNAPSSLTNTVTVSGGGELNTTNDTASDPTTIVQVADLTITKTHTGTFTQGQTGAQYTITVSNLGPGPTSGTVTVTDTLPAGLTATGISGTGWSCTLATLTCTRSDALVASSSYPVITLTVDVAGNAPASVTNTATVSGGGELNTSNDTASDPTTVISAVPNLYDPPNVTKTVDGKGFPVLRYTAVLINSGNGPALGVVFTDNIPQNTSYVFNTITLNGVPVSDAYGDADGGYDQANNRIVVNIGTINPGSQAVITFSVRVDNGFHGTISNQGRVSGSNFPDRLTDDPGTSATNDPTVFGVAPASAVPALNEWGLIVLLALMAWMSVSSLRRQRKR